MEVLWIDLETRIHPNWCYLPFSYSAIAPELCHDVLIDLELKRFLNILEYETSNVTAAIYNNFGTTLGLLTEDLAFNDAIFYDQGVPLCGRISNDGHMLHGVMKAVGKSFNSKVSLVDIPKLFNPKMPPKPGASAYLHDIVLLPYYTLCEIDPERMLSFDSFEYEEQCRKVWNDVTNGYQKFDENNPYLSENKNVSVCGKGLGNAIG